jgi:NADH-quinone oxidoreductase subunit M
MTFPILTLLIFLPVAGSILLLFIDNRDDRRDASIRVVTLVISLVVLALAILLWARFDPTSAEYQFTERHPWIPAFGIDYSVGVDGISLLLVELTAFLTPIALLSSWESVHKRVKAFSIFMLALESAMIGVFLSLDLFLFYIFWDAMLIPMYFLIGIWGYERRVYAAIKFILFTMAGGVLMLVAIITLAWLYNAQYGVYSFDLLKLQTLSFDTPTATRTVEGLLFLAFTIAFAIKVPLFPFHTWLPDAHVEAPTAGSVILAGVLLKMGTYGLVRFSFPLFPHAAITFAPYLATLAVIGIVYGALVSMVQPDLKKLVAYSSVSHLGFVVLGIAAMNMQGMQGAVYQMLNHGVSTGALFLIVGMLMDRRHTRLIAEFGGLKAVVPGLVAVFLVITLSSIGLPGLNGFVGEFLILVGTFRWRMEYGFVAALGVILSAVYMLWMFQRVNYGAVLNEKNRNLPDLSVRERWVIWPTVAMAIFMGLAPKFFLVPMERSVERVVQRLQSAAGPTTVQRLEQEAPLEKAQGLRLKAEGQPGAQGLVRPKPSEAISHKPVGLKPSEAVSRKP